MYLHLKTSIFLLLLTLVSYAGTPEQADSLIENYYASLPDDTGKVNMLYTTGYDLRTKDIEVAFKYANACLNSAITTKSDKHIAKAKNLLGILYFRTGKLNKALDLHREALALREKINDREGIAFSKVNIANIYVDQKLEEKAKTLYLEALQIFSTIGNKKLTANTLNNIGIILFGNKEFENAGNYFKQALKTGEELNDYELKAFTYNNLGAVYENLENFTEARICFEEALELRELMGNESEQADTYINIASTYFEQKEFSKAKSLLTKALVLSTSNDYSEGKLSVYNFLKDIYISENKYDSALIYQTKYYELKESLLVVEPEEKTIEPNPTTDTNAVAELKKENHILKYIVGVLSVFLVILGIAIKRLK
ncbi:MAG TPA: tetratricopeptide repeat protein [Bacteroidia bacterium]